MYTRYQTFLSMFLAPLLLCLSVVGFSVMGLVQIASAQSETRTITADDVNKIASELWCPLCSGVRLDACELKACAQMREEIAIKLEAGENLASIKQYFLERYGEQVLGAPQRKGWGWLAWLLPPIVVLSAGVLLFMRGRILINPSPAIQNSSPRQNSTITKAQESERYDEKLDEELARYE